MLLVNFLQLWFLLEELFLEDKVMEPIKCLAFICLQDDIGEQGVSFFPKNQILVYISQYPLKIIWHLLMRALGGLVYFMSICVDVLIKIGV